ncbi:MAG: hypothetical protein COA79_11250 [Planctomycetota bacterium]|nr:MAG: hypothetical protein COA79_11250 [Planctomycetota bacterium]
MSVHLSRKVQRSIQPAIRTQIFFTAIGYVLILDQVVMMLALDYGASDLQMSFLYSAVHVSSIASLLLPYVFKNIDMKNIYGWAWLARSFTALFYITLLFIGNAHVEVKIFLVIVIHFHICCFRSFGARLYVPSLKVWCVKSELTGNLASIMQSTYIGQIVGRIIAFVLLSIAFFGEDLQEFLLIFLIFIGSVANAYAGKIILKLPKVGTVVQKDSLGLKETFFNVIKDPLRSKVGLIYMFLVIQVIFIAYLLSYFKLVVGLENRELFLIMLVGLLFATAVSKLLSIISNQIPSRVLMTFSSGALILFLLLWSLFPLLGEQPTFLYCLLLNTGIFVFAGMSNTVLGQIIARSLPDENAVQVNMIYMIFGLFGAIFGTGLINFLEPIAKSEVFSQLHEYSVLGFASAIAGVLITIVMWMMPKLKNRGLKKEFSLILPSNIIDMIRMNKAYSTKDLANNRWVIEGVMLKETPVSLDLVINTLKSSNITMKYSAYRSLNANPKMEAYSYVIEEVQNIYSPLRSEAITSLGFLNNKDAIPILKKISKESDEMMISASIKSLLRLGVIFNSGEVIENYIKIENRMAKLHILVGLYSAKMSLDIFNILKFELKNRSDDSWLILVFQYYFAIFDKRETIEEIYDEERKKYGEGINYICDEIESDLLFSLKKGEILSHLKNSEFNELQLKLSQNIPAGHSVKILIDEVDAIYNLTSAIGIIFMCIVDKE